MTVFVDMTISFQIISNSLIGSPFAIIQSVPRGKVSILGGHSMGHSKQRSVYVHVSYSERNCTVHSTDEQHATSSQELQSALMSAVEFSKMYYTR
jgi:hypothetical protein